MVGFYVRDTELVAAVTAFSADAVERGGAAVVIATLPHRAALAESLRQRGISPAELAISGRYRSIDAADTLAQFMRDDRPDPHAFAATIGPILAGVAASGAPVHAFGEMVALLWDGGNVAAAIELEALWNDLASDHEFALFCAYDMSSVEEANDLAAAQRICEEHSNVIALDDPLARTPAPPASGARNKFERLFIATPSAPIRVRAFVREVLRAWDDDAAFGVAGVVAAELATNAIMHARSPFCVSMSRPCDAIRIAVRDTSTDPPEQRERDHRRTGGRGIAIVAELSRAWGTEQDSRGKVVWAEVACDPVTSD
jgi:anti-sigma regulatory factor (Ser/Thr protein kinase)